ncbi:odorant receptor 4-like isoform X2 [Linepithema humile]|uniref:odorant receptor 4-like isoform X2 n=1 Tax=Linepithema humile TaxID=83485 RepID=UPI00351E85D2
MLSQLMDIVFTVNNTDDFTDNFYVMLAMFVSCCKMFSLLKNRNNIAMLINILMEKPCKPIEHDEIEIRQKFDKFVQDYRKQRLAFRAWLPFNYSSPMLFQIAFLHQFTSLIIGSILHIACDSLICGLLVHICSQIEILECHLRKVVNKPHFLRECVTQHIYISKFAFMVNQKFKLTITIQFIVSTLVVCFNLYQMTQTSMLSAKYIQIVLYMLCMLIQISFYCWYGNEVKLKSQQLISNAFEIEWFTLDHNMQKNLLMIMTRSTIPIQLSSALVIPMNLESFVGLLKTSYSAYNILQQMRD